MARGHRHTQDTLQPFARGTLFIDSGAILDYFDTEGGLVRSFIDDSLVDQLITSQLVVAETVRRLVKAKYPARFAGPSGQRERDLAWYLLSDWLQDHHVVVLPVPRDLFAEAAREFQRTRGYGCDLTDTVSYVVICALNQNRILTTDRHFLCLGLQRLP
jgi:predicted nucleic acid-binding protein